MKRTVFISDLHLSEKKTHLNDLFDVFIQDTLAENGAQTNIDAVYILGDFFDVWLGDDMAGSWEKNIMDKLTALVEAGVPVYFMQGNRDFLLEKSFVQKAKVVFLEDPAFIELYGKKIILKHGDDLCSEDRRYQIFRRIVRTDWVKQLYLKLPLFFRQKIAMRIRKTSRERGMRESYAKVSIALVKKLFCTADADILIHGHTHRPQMEKMLLEKRERQHIILCDWNVRGNRLFFDEVGQLKFDYFN
jgi:UDP-2,3-diacylglucosamine hydrolase